MSLGADLGVLMSPALLRVAELAKHDPESGGRHPGVLTPDFGSGRGPGGRFSLPGGWWRCLRRLTLVLRGPTTRLSDGLT